MQCPSFLPPFSKTHSMAEAEEAGQPGEGRRTDGGTGGDYWLPFRSSSSNPPCTCHGRMKRGGEGMGLLTVLSSPALRSVVGGELFPWKKRGGGQEEEIGRRAATKGQNRTCNLFRDPIPNPSPDCLAAGYRILAGRKLASPHP